MIENKALHLLGGNPHVTGDITPPSRVPTPLRGTPKSLRPYVYALMAFKHGRDFQAKQSTHRTRRLSQLAAREGPFAPALTVSATPLLVLYRVVKLTLSDSLRRYISCLQRFPHCCRSGCYSRQYLPSRFLCQEYRAQWRTTAWGGPHCGPCD